MADDDGDLHKSVSRNRYHRVDIGGNASAQLGDRYIDKQENVSIDTAIFLLQENIDLSKLGLAQALRWSQIVPALEAHQNEAREIDATNDVSDGRERDCLGRTRQPQRASFAPTSPKRVDKSLEKRRSVNNAARNRSQGRDRALPSQNLCMAEESSPQGLCTGSNNALVQPGPQLVALLTLALSCLIGRNVSTQELAAFINRCQQDSLLPMLTALLAFGFARFWYAGQVVRNPSGFDELGATLEDAYGLHEFVSMSICADYTIFKSFLEVHYRNAGRSAGQMLVQANQFHTMLGSRRGAVIDTEGWDVKPGSFLVNSLYVTTEEAKCLLCKSNLAVGDLGNLHCYDCDLYFRDFNAIQTRSILMHRKPRGVSAILAGKRPFNDTWEDDSNLVQYLDETQIEFEGLKHIDIRVVPRKTPIPALKDARTDTRNLASRGLQHNEWWQCKFSVCRHICYRKENFVQHLVREHRLKEPNANRKSATKGFDREELEFWNLVNECRLESAVDTRQIPQGLWSPPPARLNSPFTDMPNMQYPVASSLRVGKDAASQEDGIARLNVSAKEGSSSQRARAVHFVTPSQEQQQVKLRGILKPPRSTPFPEHPIPVREGVAALEPDDSNIPPGAKWTKISRRVVNPEALERAEERFEEREDYVIVLRVLRRHEIQKLADETKKIRDQRAHDSESLCRLDPPGGHQENEEE